MSKYDFAAPRLFVDDALFEGARVTPTDPAQNYLLNVLRLASGQAILLFNGRDGEWRATLEMVSRRAAALMVGKRAREQEKASGIEYAFAPLKQARLDYMAQKAVEMGASRLSPVLTRRAQVRAISAHRLRANAIEAAEQCGVLSIPEIRALQPLDAFLVALPAERLLIFCDEDAASESPLAALRDAISAVPSIGGIKSVSLLIGPEGGFEASERQEVLQRQNVLRISLGARVLRADTAAVAALALIQATLED